VAGESTWHRKNVFVHRPRSRPTDPRSEYCNALRIGGLVVVRAIPPRKVTLSGEFSVGVAAAVLTDDNETSQTRLDDRGDRRDLDTIFCAQLRR